MRDQNYACNLSLIGSIFCVYVVRKSGFMEVRRGQILPYGGMWLHMEDKKLENFLKEACGSIWKTKNSKTSLRRQVAPYFQPKKYRGSQVFHLNFKEAEMEMYGRYTRFYGS